MNLKTFKLPILLLATLLLAGCTFVDPYSVSQPGFLYGIWHGLVAPYTLIIRWFTDIKMYADPNAGFLYDVGFLIGVAGSLPIGWIAAIISIGFLVLHIH